MCAVSFGGQVRFWDFQFECVYIFVLLFSVNRNNSLQLK